MGMTCGQCGASLTESEAFCTKCGARQTATDETAGPHNFCTKCGAPLLVQTKFCAKCGAPVGVPPIRAGSPDPANFNKPAGQFSKLLLAGIVGLFFVAVMITTGIVYVAHRAKQKVTSLEAALPAHDNRSEKKDAAGAEQNSDSPSGSQSYNASPNGTADLSGAFGQLLKGLGVSTDPGAQPHSHTKTASDFSDVPGGFAPGEQLAASCPDAAPAVAESRREMVKVPLRPGLTWVDAWHRFNGDVEIINKVEAITQLEVDTSTSGLGFPSSDSVQGTEVDSTRHVCRADLENASTYITDTDASLPEIIPQTTTFSMSQASLQTLKTTGKVRLVYQEFEYLSGRMVPVPRTVELTRIEQDDVNYPVILNGQPTNLPVVHARGYFHFSGSDKVKEFYKERDSLSYLEADGEIFVLDDSGSPMVLQIGFGPMFKVRVVSIDFPEEQSNAQIEQQLEKQKKAVVYGIYFDFNQASIKKESQPVLKEIADAMRNNPDWNLTVNGYTDNIGGNAYNVDLSKRRAAAVKDALVKQYRIAMARLNTGGFGASDPVETNETLEGRARNRRVELIRQ